MQLNSHLLAQLSHRLAAQNVPLRLCFWDGRSTDLAPEPHVCVTLKSPKAVRYFLSPDLDTLGAAYVEGDIEIDGSIPEIMAIAEQLSRAQSAPRRRTPFRLHFGNRHTRHSDANAIHYHYDVSNEFYALWLDKNMVYSCAYFKNGQETLDQAQEQKLDHICRKLNLQPGERFLDIGCGWGGLIRWAAQHYGVKAVGVTLSQEQYDYARARVEKEGLSGQIEVRLQDYRDIPGAGNFDKIASVGMFEHVGLKNLPTYFNTIHRLLKPGGLLLNHGITTRDPDGHILGSDRASFIHRYVFPDGELPHLSLVAAQMERQKLEVLDVESLRPHYAQTLMHWVDRLEAQREQAIQLAGAKRYRIWRIYMAGCAHAFRHGKISIYQLLASKNTEDGSSVFSWTREYQYGNQAFQTARPGWPES